MTAFRDLATPYDAVPLPGGDGVVVLRHAWDLSTREFCQLHAARQREDWFNAASLVSFPPLPPDPDDELLRVIVGAFHAPRPGNPDNSEPQYTEPDAWGNTYKIGLPADAGVPIEEFDYGKLFARLTAAYGFPEKPWEDLPRYRLDWYTENLRTVAAERALAHYNAAVAASGNLKKDDHRNLLDQWKREAK